MEIIHDLNYRALKCYVIDEDVMNSLFYKISCFFIINKINLKLLISEPENGII